jgi:hypothetical protein
MFYRWRAKEVEFSARKKKILTKMFPSLKKRTPDEDLGFLEKWHGSC